VAKEILRWSSLLNLNEIFHDYTSKYVLLWMLCDNPHQISVTNANQDSLAQSRCLAFQSEKVSFLDLPIIQKNDPQSIIIYQKINYLSPSQYCNRANKK
jgi:hypothetical protein